MLAFLKRRPKDPVEQALAGHALPSFPRVAHRALAMLRDPNGSPNAIGDALSEDPALSVKVLGVANSSAFALRHPVRTVAHAVSLLGRGQVESLLLSIVVARALPKPTVDGYDEARFWRTAARRAAAARALADRIQPSVRAECFTASLLSDMAVPLLARAHGDRYGAVLRAWHADGGELAALERDALGVDHAEVASGVAERWSFPPALAAAIGDHHGDATGLEALAPVAIVAPLREADDAGVEVLVSIARDRFQLPPDDVIAILERTKEDADAIASRMR